MSGVGPSIKIVTRLPGRSRRANAHHGSVGTQLRHHLKTMRCGASRATSALLQLFQPLIEGRQMRLWGARVRELRLLTILSRFDVKVVAIAGMCGAAVALSPAADAVPLNTDGYACIETAAGDAMAPAAAAGCNPASAPLNDMAGIPMALPGPIPVPAAAPVPVGAPVPLGAPVPVGAPLPVGAPVPLGAPVGAPVPLGAPVAAGAPLIDMAGGLGGKGAPTGPPPPGALQPGQPILPGPSATG